MVAVLVGLRFRVLWNSLQRNVWQLVGAAFAALYGLGVMAVAVAGLFALGFTGPDLIASAVTVGGSLLVLGWVVGPLFVAGVDQTLDPVKLSVFPVPRRTLFRGLTIAAVLGIPGIVTSVLALATALAWWRHPLAAVAAVVCSVVAVLTCVCASRAVTALSASLTSGRRYREVVGIVVLIPIMLAGPIVMGVTSGVTEISELLPALAAGLRWTPIGAIWAVPGAVAAGSWGLAAAHLSIALATVAVLAWLWWLGLERQLDSPAAAASAGPSRAGLGFFRWMPATPTGAVAARSLSYWIRDPRYSKQLVSVVAVIVIIALYSAFGTSSLTGMLVPAVALLFALTIYAEVATDGTAFALHLSSGVSGRADRAGRVIAVSIIAVPVLLLVAIGLAAFSGDLSGLPTSIGLGMALLLSGFGAASIVSALIVFPVPGPGDSAFKTQPGAGLPSTIALLGTWGGAGVATIPVIALAIAAAVTGDALYAWLTLIVGIVWGAGCLVAGVLIGGRLLDRRGPDLLARLRA